MTRAWSPLARIGAGLRAYSRLREGRGLYFELKLGDAEPVLRDAFSLAKQAGSSRLIAEAARDYYYLLRRTKRYVEGVVVLEERLAAQVRAEGRDSEAVLDTRNELIWLCGKLERFDQAERVTRQRLESAQRRSADKQREHGFALVTLGWALLNQARVDEAEAVYREALAVLERAAGEEDGVTGWSLLGLAAIAVRRRDISEAEAQLKRAFANWDRVGRADMAARSREKLMDLYLEHGDFPKAVELADAEMQQVNRLGLNNRRRLRNLERHVAALEGAGRLGEAARLTTRATYLRQAVERDRAELAMVRQRENAQRDEEPGPMFEGEEEWPLATPVF
jgi:tetratricopeptide (TPR) repeat protein